MKYVTMIPAFGVPCDRNSCGKWNLRKEDFTNEDKFTTRESDESPLGEYGIELNKLVPYREYCTWPVADHVRAYCDMVYECKFEELKGLFHECIADLECRKDIFMLIYGKMRTVGWFDSINKFMSDEFGNAWSSYVDSVKSAANHVDNMADRYERMMKGEIVSSPSDLYKNSTTVSK